MEQTMTISQTNDEIILKFSKNIDIDGLQDFFDYITYKEAVLNSQATQDDVDKLEKEIKSNWWSKNRERLLNEADS
jgi:hypothetical protein